MSDWVDVLILIGIIFCSLVLYGLLGFSMISVIKNILAYTWPKVDGKILSVKIKEETEPGELTIYSPMIEYEYIVNKKSISLLDSHMVLSLIVHYLRLKKFVKNFLKVK